MAHAISPVSQCCVSGETGAYSDRSVGWAAGAAAAARVDGHTHVDGHSMISPNGFSPCMPSSSTRSSSSHHTVS